MVSIGGTLAYLCYKRPGIPHGTRLERTGPSENRTWPVRWRFWCFSSRGVPKSAGRLAWEVLGLVGDHLLQPHRRRQVPRHAFWCEAAQNDLELSNATFFT